MATLLRHTGNRDTLDKLIQTVPKSSGPSASSLTVCKDPPPPLDPKNYRDIQFWTAKSFENHFRDLVGETDGLATKQKRRGRRRKSSEGKDRHPYLETVDGMPVPREVLVKVGQKARRLWQALNTGGLAPSSWGKASEVAYKYFHGEMLNEPEFEFFRYCEGNWKLARWATKAYASWKHNHLKLDGEDSKLPGANKRKRELLEDTSLLQISDEMAVNPENTAASHLPTSESSPVAVSHTDRQSDSDLAEVCDVCPHHYYVLASIPISPTATGHNIYGSPVRDYVYYYFRNSLKSFIIFYTATIFTTKSIPLARLGPATPTAPKFSPRKPLPPLLCLQSH